MGKRAKAGTFWPELVRLGVETLQVAERRFPRTGPGAKPEIPDWVMAALIMIALLNKKKSKSGQFRFLSERRSQIAAALRCPRFPSRATYFRRYRRAHRLYRDAIRVQGEEAITEGVLDPQHVAVDKSLVAAAGPPWHVQDRRAGKVRAGVDRDGTWSFSEHDGWVFGYSYEVVVSATSQSVVFPLLASADTASASETRTFADKLAQLPSATRIISADSGYDVNDYGERIEFDGNGRRTRRRFLCPANPRNTVGRKLKTLTDARLARSRQRRLARQAFLKSPRGRRLYARRNKTAEPFNQWFKSLFELDHRVWHRGLDNNRTLILGAIFAYQLLVRHNYRCGRPNGRVRWLLDAL